MHLTCLTLLPSRPLLLSQPSSSPHGSTVHGEFRPHPRGVGEVLMHCVSTFGAILRTDGQPVARRLPTLDAITQTMNNINAPSGFRTHYPCQNPQLLRAVSVIGLCRLAIHYYLLHSLSDKLTSEAEPHITS
jgi:hypothetical protein